MSSSKAEYLKRYLGGGGGASGEEQAKKKRKKKPVVAAAAAGRAGGVLIVDDDDAWKKPLSPPPPLQEEDDADEAPAVEETVEVRAMNRRAMLRERMEAEGSGWVTLSTDTGQGQSELGHRDLDLSPPRSRVKAEQPSPPRRHESPDLSPPRRAGGADLSPQRRVKTEQLSPSRPPQVSIKKEVPSPRRRLDSPDLSPPRRKHTAAQAADLSPPRRRATTGASPRRNGRHDSPDLSPPRRQQAANHGDLSPPRRRARIEQSPPSRAHQVRVKEELASPKHRGRHDSPDLSPPRREDTLSKKPLHMTDGTLAGLRTGRELRDEIEQKKIEDARRFAAMDTTKSGRGAETVYRDKRGKRLEGLTELMRQQQGAKPTDEDRQTEWGKGLAQKQQAEARAADLAAERAKPFARYEDDADLDSMLKSRSRWGDPMAHLVKGNAKDNGLEDISKKHNLDLETSGFTIPQDVPLHSWLKRGVPAPPNRYSIRPGRHWDGVDRSTGFEANYFKIMNEKSARSKQAYEWSVAEM
eukprot:jgi/Chlat1/688/Chrsp104S01166